MTEIKNKTSLCMVTDLKNILVPGFYFNSPEFVNDSSINTTETTQKLIFTQTGQRFKIKAGGSVIAETLHLKS